MAAVKANQIIDTAYTLAGIKAIGEPTSGDMSEYALALLNGLLDQWNADALYIPDNIEIIQSITGKAVTIGVGKTINTPRPVRMLDTSFFRIGDIDYPIEWIDQATYNALPYKTLSTAFPQYGYYDYGVPDGTIYFWPYPASSTELHLQVETQLPGFTDYATPANMPQGYLNALQYTLAELLCIGIKEPSQMLMKYAMQARVAIRVNNNLMHELTSGYEASGMNAKAAFLAGF